MIRPIKSDLLNNCNFIPRISEETEIDTNRTTKITA